MASNYFYLCIVCISICVRMKGIAANEDTYLHYSLNTDEKCQSSLSALKFVELENESRVRRYVSNPISQLADGYDQRKTKFFSDPSSTLTDTHSILKLEKVSVAEKKISPADAPAHDQPVNDNRVHTPAPQIPASSPIVDNKPPRTNATSSIVSADFGATVQSTTNASVPSNDDDELPILPSDKLINNTINQNNITQNSFREDNHIFYNSSFIIDSDIGQSYWVNMEGRNDVITNDMLSKSHRRAATVKLMFNFPFYGHMVRNVTIATGGFLYTGEYVHSWLAATQYIAPLMANFDTSISNGSYIKYVDNGTSFTVQWEKVVLQDKPDSGDFTFQATLHSNGDIVFVYQTIPVEIETIQDDQHPVKVGLSDAYIIDRTIFFVRRKTIYEYHRVNFKKEDIKNWTVIYLKALPTCLDKKDCESCLTEDIGFECIWCPGVKRCSTGMDRMRQDWLHKQCDKIEKGNVSSCNEPDPKHSQHTSGEKAGLQIISDEGKNPDDNRIGMSSILGVLFLIGLICGVGIWTLYAYNNPHSSSGQILIRYRPSQWSWRRGEARYTAATIHM